MSKTLFQWVDERGQTAVAALLGVHKSTISKICKGSQTISDDLHASAIGVWGDQYNLDDSVRESLHRRGMVPRAAEAASSDAA